MINVPGYTVDVFHFNIKEGVDVFDCQGGQKVKLLGHFDQSIIPLVYT